MRPCLIVVNDDWMGAAERNQFINVDSNDALVLSLDFRLGAATVTAVALQVDNGKVTRIPKSRKDALDFSGFLDDVRQLQPGDPAMQLFILTRRSQ